MTIFRIGGDMQEPKSLFRLQKTTWGIMARCPFPEQDIYVMVACECERDRSTDDNLYSGKGITLVSNQDGHLTEADA